MLPRVFRLSSSPVSFILHLVSYTLYLPASPYVLYLAVPALGLSSILNLPPVSRILYPVPSTLCLASSIIHPVSFIPHAVFSIFLPISRVLRSSSCILQQKCLGHLRLAHPISAMLWDFSLTALCLELLSSTGLLLIRCLPLAVFRHGQYPLERQE